MCKDLHLHLPKIISASTDYIPSCLVLLSTGDVWTSEGLGEGTPEAGKSQHCHRAGREQVRPRRQETGGVRGAVPQHSICLSAYRGLVSEPHLKGQTVSLVVKVDKAACLLDQEGTGSEQDYWIPKAMACGISWLVRWSCIWKSFRVTSCEHKYRKATLYFK